MNDFYVALFKQPCDALIMTTAIKAYETVPGRTWSLVHVATGMEVGLITGKRRMRACMASLAGFHAATWQEWAAVVSDWRRANPRKAAA